MKLSLHDIENLELQEYYLSFFKRNFSEPPFAPWSIFVVDNTFHLLSILLIIKLF